MQPFSKAILLVLLSSFTWALWSILIDIVDATGTANFVGYTTIAEFGTAALGFVILFAYLRVKKKRFPRWERKFFVFALLAGVMFGLGTVLFFSLLGGVSYPFVTSVQMASVVALAFIIGWVTKQRIGRRYVLGTLIAFIGFVFQVFGLYGTDLSASQTTIIASVGVMALFTLGYYFQFRYIYKGLSPIEGAFPVSGTAFLTVLVYGLLSNGYANISALTGYQIGISALIAVVVIIAALAEAFAFRAIRKAKLWELNVINILTNFELVWVIVFTAFFLAISLPQVIGGLILVFLGMMVVSSSQ